MSNLARATNPFSKILCSSAYSIAPDKETMLLHIVLPEEDNVAEDISPRVQYLERDNNSNEQSDEDVLAKTSSASSMGPEDVDAAESFIKRLTTAISAAKKLKPARLSIELPGKIW